MDTKKGYGWGKVKPKTQKARKALLDKCGKKCFLGPRLTYPICLPIKAQHNIKPCAIDERALWSAYLRGKQWSNKSNKKKNLKTDLNNKKKNLKTDLNNKKKNLKKLNQKTHRRVWKRAMVRLKQRIKELA